MTEWVGLLGMLGHWNLNSLPIPENYEGIIRCKCKNSICINCLQMKAPVGMENEMIAYFKSVTKIVIKGKFVSNNQLVY